jgi:hypothetical protein
VDLHARALRPKSPVLLRTPAVLAVALAATTAAAQEAPDPFSIGESLARGRFTLELRPRYNNIEESDKQYRTTGGTVRLLAGYQSAPIAGARIVLEGIHANQVAKHFNDNGADFATSPYPLLPDPKYTGVNQAYVDFSPSEALRVRGGRQVVRMDNQRWISDNNFRQIQQVFDGVGAAYGGPFGVELYGAWYGAVRTTSGEKDDLNLTLLHAAWNPAPGHALVGYGYFHDQAQNGAFTGFANSSYRVAGVRAEGPAFRAGAFDFPYEAE